MGFIIGCTDGQTDGRLLSPWSIFIYIALSHRTLRYGHYNSRFINEYIPRIIIYSYKRILILVPALYKIYVGTQVQYST